MTQEEYYMHPQGLLVKRKLVTKQYRWWCYIPKENNWIRTTIDTKDRQTLIPYLIKA